MDRAAAADCGARHDDQVEGDLGAVLGNVARLALPDEIRLFMLHIAGRDGLGVVEVDHRRLRAGGAEGDPRELQLGDRRLQRRAD